MKTIKCPNCKIGIIKIDESKEYVRCPNCSKVYNLKQYNDHTSQTQAKPNQIEPQEALEQISPAVPKTNLNNNKILQIILSSIFAIFSIIVFMMFFEPFIGDGIMTGVYIAFNGNLIEGTNCITITFAFFIALLLMLSSFELVVKNLLQYFGIIQSNHKLIKVSLSNDVQMVLSIITPIILGALFMILCLTSVQACDMDEPKGATSLGIGAIIASMFALFASIVLSILMGLQTKELEMDD